MKLLLQKLFLIVILLSVDSSLIIKNSTKNTFLINSVQNLVNDLVKKYFSRLKCINFIKMNSNYNITVNTNCTVTQASIIGDIDNSVNRKIIGNVLKHGVKSGCKGYIIQVESKTYFMSLLSEVLKKSINRQNPKMIFLPDNFNNHKLSKGFVNHFLMQYITDILIIDIKFIESYQNEYNYFYEFSTIRWMAGEHQLLGSCPMVNCKISNMDLYPKKLNDLGGKELRLATMDYPPYSILRPNQPPDGIEVRIFKLFAAMYNATWSVVTDDKQWGFVFTNGSSGEGVLGAVADGRADFGCAAIFMWYDPHLLLEYTVSYIRSGVTCLVPRAQVVPKWLLPRLPFSPSTWVILTTSLFLSTGVMYAFHKFANSYIGEKQISTIADCAIKSIGLLTSQTVSRHHFRPPYRTILTLFHTYFFLICVYYSTGLASFLTVPTYEKQINTVDDLVESGLIWGGTHDVWLFSIGGAEIKTTKKLLSRYHTLPFDELKTRSFKRDMAYAIERLPGGYYAIGDFITEEATDNLVVMDGDIYYEYCGLAAFKISPYLRNINRLILRLMNAGIVNHWEMDVANLYLSSKIQMGVNKNNQGPTSGKSGKAIALKLMHLSGAFILLSTCLTFGIIVFVAEIIIFRYKRRKKITRCTDLYPRPIRVNRQLGRHNYISRFKRTNRKIFNRRLSFKREDQSYIP